MNMYDDMAAAQARQRDLERIEKEEYEAEVEAKKAKQRELDRELGRQAASNLPTKTQTEIKRQFDEAFKRYVYKSRDYGENHVALGSRGQFADIWRKIQKLKRALWDGHALVDEQPEEVLQDLMAHCALALQQIARERTP